jgi:integrase
VKILENTASKIKVPEGKRDILVFDESLPGFGIRKFESGKASFFVKYTLPGGKQRKITLGAVVPGVAAEMRRKASDILAKARLGQDVVAEKEAAARRGSSVGSLIQKYLAARRSEVGARYYVELERYLARYWEPLHDMDLESVKRRDIVLRVDEIAEDKGKVTADRAKDALGGFFAWAVEKCYVEANPANGVKRRTTNGARSRVLTEQELAEVWHACGDDDHGRILRLLILTGRRRSEIGDLVWSEINREGKQIDLPQERTKNGLPHIVPLSDEALAILDSIPARHNREFVFGEGAGGYAGWSRSKTALDARINAARQKAGKKPMPPWVVHDIRRSVITILADDGYALPHVVEMLVNHQSGHKKGVAGTYNKAKYLAERCKALDAWGKHIAPLVETCG